MSTLYDIAEMLNQARAGVSHMETLAKDLGAAGNR